jgi:hypothetical protein
MGIISDIENLFSPSSVTADEAFVQNLLTEVKGGVAAVKTDMTSSINWLVAQEAGVSADVAALEAFATAMGAAANPVVATAIEAANVAVQALAALKTSATAGASTMAEIQAAYAAIKQALGLASTATATVTG